MGKNLSKKYIVYIYENFYSFIFNFYETLILVTQHYEIYANVGSN